MKEKLRKILADISTLPKDEQEIVRKYLEDLTITEVPREPRRKAPKRSSRKD